MQCDRAWRRRWCCASCNNLRPALARPGAEAQAFVSPARRGNTRALYYAVGRSNKDSGALLSTRRK
jgi:hypothetical protein